MSSQTHDSAGPGAATGASSDDGAKVVIKIEDDRTGMSPEALKRALLDHLIFSRSKDINIHATPSATIPPAISTVA